MRLIFLLSRWEVCIEQRRYLGLKRGAKVLTMNNYLGLGCDAGIALNFHRQRESRPELFKSRIINKVCALGIGFTKRKKLFIVKSCLE